MRTHTPGPWKDILEGYDYVVRSEGGQGYRVLSIRTGVIPSPPDARLIAAAPEMLDTLAELIAEHDERSRQQMETPGYGPIPDTGGIVLARMLLARINGEG